MAKKIFFRDYGKGDDLVILHGILGSSDMWIPVARRLSERFHVIVPDLPNHGLSEHTDSMDLNHTANALINLLKSNKITQPTIIAHSYGAKVAFLMMVLGFDMASLVAVDMLPATTYADPQILQLLHLIEQPLPPLKSFAHAKQLFAEKGIQPQFADLLAKGLAMNNGLLQWKFNAPVIARNAEQIRQSVELKGVFDKQLLVIAGQNSNYVDQSAIADAKTHFKNINIIEIPDAGHWVHYDQPERFFNTIYSHLTNNNL